MSQVLEINDLSAGYRQGHDVIRHVNLSLEHGEAIAVVGKNGCGKSTLAKSIVGLTPFRSGSVTSMGRSLMPMTIDQMRQVGVAIMLQGAPVFAGLTVREHLLLATHDDKHNGILQELKEIIPLFKDGKNMSKKADQLSGGERHHLALAMTLATAQKIVILDEPSAGLMPYAINELYDVLKKIKNTFNTSFLLIEHNIKQAEEFASRFAFMAEGKIVYQGNDNDLIEELMLK